MNNQSKTMFALLAVAVAAVFIASTVLVTTEAEAAKLVEKIKGKGKKQLTRAEEAPIATSGDNAYITWWSNKTGNEEVMFRASTDNGATFGDKINLSNTTAADSDDAEIAASGDSVYVTWWERNETSDIPVARVSNDNGATFGPMLMLATNGTIGGQGG
jgi:lipopolysaccharide export LptBFGC system permease protein LptF